MRNSKIEPLVKNSIQDASRANDNNAESSCCGGAPLNNEDACCKEDEEKKEQGESGCGCNSSKSTESICC